MHFKGMFFVDYRTRLHFPLLLLLLFCFSPRVEMVQAEPSDRIRLTLTGGLSHFSNKDVYQAEGLTNGFNGTFSLTKPVSPNVALALGFDYLRTRNSSSETFRVASYTESKIVTFMTTQVAEVVTPFMEIHLETRIPYFDRGSLDLGAGIGLSQFNSTVESTDSSEFVESVNTAGSEGEGLSIRLGSTITKKLGEIFGIGITGGYRWFSAELVDETRELQTPQKVGTPGFTSLELSGPYVALVVIVSL